MTDIIQLACILRDRLDDLIAGTREAPGMRSILKFATPHLVASKNECSSSRNSLGNTFTKGKKRTAVEGGTPCGHICPQHPAALDSAVRSRLPDELQELIFAKLRVPEIHRLRCLSKQWKRNMIGKSRFICAETNSKIFALISEDMDWYGNFWVKLYDFNTNKWHVFKLFLGDLDEPFQTMSAADGGLLCFISAWKKTNEKPLEIVVCNPLTQDVRTFGLDGVSTDQVKLIQIVTNRDTGHYKLIVAGHKNIPSLDAPDYLHFSELNLNELNDDSIPIGGVSVEYYALVRDRLFVLREESHRCFVGDPNDADDRDDADDQDNADDFDDADLGISRVFMVDHYCISEYQGQTTHPNWVKLRTINCSPFKLRASNSEYWMRLYACEGFLLVVAHNDEWNDPYDHEIGWLYDSSTDEWRVLPNLPGGIKLQDTHDNLMCELRWDVVNLSKVVAEHSLLCVGAPSDEF